MPQDALDDLTKGAPLVLVVQQLITAIAAKTFPTQSLHRNKETGGFFTLPATNCHAILNQYVRSNFLTLALINRRDEKTLLALIRNHVTLTCFEDWITNDLQADTASDLTDLIFSACEETLQSAINEIARLQPPEQEIQTGMPLKGTLQKCVNYMALLFRQHGYEFLNIVFNMATKEYELLTPAELNTLNASNHTGDRRVVLHCTIYELKKLTTSPQLKLELPNVQETGTQDSQDRKLPTRESTD